MKTTGWMALLLLCSGAALAVDDAAKVLDCMRKNVPDSLRVQDVEFATADRAGTASTRHAASRCAAQSGRRGLPDPGKRERRARRHVRLSALGAPRAPRDREHRRRRTDGHQFLVRGFQADAEYLRRGEHDARGHRRDRQATHPRDGVPNEGGYSLVRSWVDFQTCVPLKVEFYEGAALRKRMTSPVNSLKQVDAYWYPSVVEMHDLKEELRTTLRVLKVTPDKNLSGGYFDPKTFYQR
jgi:hypothetical protein